MQRRAVRKIEHDFIDETPAPSFRRIKGFDDQVLRRTEMFCSVSIWRLIAAADMAAATADTQMQPRLAHLQAFFTPSALGTTSRNRAT
jgi:hypothetical protein